MTTVSFDFADTYTVETRDVEMDVPVTELPTEMQAKIFGYGFSVFTDAANGAPRAAAVDALGDKKDKETADAYNKRLAAWYKDTTNAPAILAKTEELIQKYGGVMLPDEYAGQLDYDADVVRQSRSPQDVKE